MGRPSSDHCRRFGPNVRRGRSSFSTDLSSAIVSVSSDSWPTDFGLLTVLHCVFFAAGNKSSS